MFVYVLFMVLQRNRTNRICAYKEIYFKELVHVIVVSPKSGGEAGSLETQGRVESKSSAGRIPSF